MKRRADDAVRNQDAAQSAQIKRNSTMNKIENATAVEIGDGWCGTCR
jgi:hypothetical protein